MDFELTDDEAALGESVRALCNSRFTLERLQQAAGSRESVFDSKGWSTLADAGVFALQVPEAAGGVGLGMGPSAVVFEELGRALVPGPLVSSHLAARDLSRALDGVAEGKLVVGSVRITSRGEPDALAPLLVSHLSSLDALVLVDDNALAVVDPCELEAEPISRSLDPLTPLWRVKDLPEGKAVGDEVAASTWVRDESVLTGAILVGMAGRCLDMAVAYAKEREQFGKPIGSFQAVKHICSDMLVRAETARIAVQAAAVTVDQPEVGDADRAAAGAAMLAGEAALLNAKACIQVHGGMGFTWEVPAHLFLMRIRILAGGLGPAGGLAELVAELY